MSGICDLGTLKAREGDLRSHKHVLQGDRRQEIPVYRTDLLERRQAGHRLTDNERMNVMRTLIGIHTLQICHVPH